MAPSPKSQSNGDRMSGGLRLAIPSDGEMFEPTQTFLADCGMPVNRPSARRYTASIPAITGL